MSARQRKGRERERERESDRGREAEIAGVRGPGKRRREGVREAQRGSV